MNGGRRFTCIVVQGNLLHRLLRRQSSATTRVKNTVPFKLTDIGEGIAEVELLKWFIKEGDVIRSFDKVCEVQSDKATVEITSRYAGIVRAIHHKEGAIVKVGSALVDIETDTGIENDSSTVDRSVGTDAGIKMEVSQEINQLMKSPTSATIPFSRDAGLPTGYHKDTDRGTALPLTTPAVRRLAKEMGLDLTSVSGSGPGGRITKEDLIRMSDNQPSEPVQPSGVSHISSSAASSDGESSRRRVVPLRGVHRLMVRSMTESLKVPQLTYNDDIECDKLLQFKSSMRELGLMASIMPLIIKATSLALNKHPTMNCSVLCPNCSEIVYNDDHNIGVAMDTAKGLLVPVIKEVQLKSIQRIAEELLVLQEKAHSGTLTEADLAGGTFTLSNIGSIGGISAIPLVLVPQVGIGAFGRIKVSPRYIGAVAAGVPQIPTPVSVMTVSWSADHRVVDGASVARFSNTWKKLVENPTTIMHEMIIKQGHVHL